MARKRKTVRAAGSARWRVGYGECDITPKPGQSFMAGYGCERYARGTLAPLRGQALAIADSRGKSVVMITADVLGFDQSSVDALRRSITADHGLADSAVMFAASHTHWGPAISYGMNFGVGAPNPWYIRFLEQSLIGAVDQALAGLSPATVSYGVLNTRIGLNRRAFDPDGAPRRQRGPNPRGHYDEHTPVLHIHRRRAPREIVLVDHACHPTDSGPMFSKWWPSYPGVMRSQIEKDLGHSARALFVTGCGGDAKVCHRHPKTGKWVFSASPTHSRTAGCKLARAVLAHLDGGRMVEVNGRIHCALVSGELTYARPRPRQEVERLALEGKGYEAFWARQMLAYPIHRRTHRYQVQAWRIGRQLTVVGLEGEPCSDLGPLIRSLAHTELAMVIGYANALTGYVPTAQIVRDGGYEGDTSHMAYFLPAPFTTAVEGEFMGIVKRAVRSLG